MLYYDFGRSKNPYFTLDKVHVNHVYIIMIIINATYKLAKARKKKSERGVMKKRVKTTTASNQRSDR